MESCSSGVHTSCFEFIDQVNERLRGSCANLLYLASSEWTRFFDVFSKQHEGWIASLEVFGDQVGAQTEAVELESVLLLKMNRSRWLSTWEERQRITSVTIERPRHVC
jgi:hypothetical protein